MSPARSRRPARAPPPANVLAYGAVPELRRRWPEYRPAVAKALKDVGIDLPELQPAPPAKKK